MTASSTAINDYMRRLRSLAATTDHIQRFYLFMNDDQLADMEFELAESDNARAFYDAVLEEYRVWKREMGTEIWQEVEANNDSLNGANRNWLLDEL